MIARRARRGLLLGPVARRLTPAQRAARVALVAAVLYLGLSFGLAVGARSCVGLEQSEVVD